MPKEVSREMYLLNLILNYLKENYIYLMVNCILKYIIDIKLEDITYIL